MQHSSMREVIRQQLSSTDQTTAMELIDFLAHFGVTFKKDECNYWKDKHYYWGLLNEQCICFIAIKNPEEPANRWTIWTDDMDSTLLNDPCTDQSIKEAAWRYADHCDHCGSCPGGRRKMIFGKEFDDICGCTFRVDNPSPADLTFLKTIIALHFKSESTISM